MLVKKIANSYRFGLMKLHTMSDWLNGYDEHCGFPIFSQ